MSTFGNLNLRKITLWTIHYFLTNHPLENQFLSNRHLGAAANRHLGALPNRHLGAFSATRHLGAFGATRHLGAFGAGRHLGAAADRHLGAAANRHLGSLPNRHLGVCCQMTLWEINSVKPPSGSCQIAI